MFRRLRRNALNHHFGFTFTLTLPGIQLLRVQIVVLDVEQPSAAKWRVQARSLVLSQQYRASAELSIAQSSQVNAGFARICGGPQKQKILSVRKKLGVIKVAVFQAGYVQPQGLAASRRNHVKAQTLA